MSFGGNAYTVYMHVFPNGKRYIGITYQAVNRRWREGEGYKGQAVYDAIKKYGWENIEHLILYEGLTKEEAEQKEIELIVLYKTKSHENGYNVENGGNCSVLAESSKKKISEANKGRLAGEKHFNYGKHLSEETRRKIAASHVGYKPSEKQKQRARERFSGKGNPMYGVPIPPEHKAKLQAACVKAKSKPVRCLETGIEYPSSAEAQRQTGICSRGITAVCNHTGYYKTAGGFRWEYVR